MLQLFEKLYVEFVSSNLKQCVNNILVALHNYSGYLEKYHIYIEIALILYLISNIAVYCMINAKKLKNVKGPIQNAHRVLFVISHPDDECMFFGPAVIHLLKLNTCNVFLLCLSDGSYRNIGNIRKKELWESCSILGMPSSNIILYKASLLPDDPKSRWNEKIIGNIVLNHIEQFRFDAVITFDKYGVSSHLNHTSVYYGVADLCSKQLIPKFPTQTYHQSICVGAEIRNTILIILNIPNLVLFESRSFTRSSLLYDESWLQKLLVRRIEPTKESHSRMLSDKEVIYALYTHNVRPDCATKYCKNYESSVSVLSSLQSSKNCELIASWKVEVGDLDQFLHLWKFSGGFSGVDSARKHILENSDYQALKVERGTYLRARHLQFLLAFSYWPQIELRSGRNIYEIRSYTLKPGTMIEWGNNWARAINFRTSNDEPFAGFFSQIGRLYNVHHIWCYKNLQSRKETRENAWRSPGWDECVAYTVPLIQQMQSRILSPLPFSPTK